MSGKVNAFAAAGLGGTFATLDNSTLDDPSGVLFHFIVGLGGTYAVSQGMELVGGLYYERHAGSLEGETNGVDIEFEGAVISRVLLTAGIGF